MARLNGTGRCGGAHLVSLRDSFVDVFSKRFAWNKLPVSRCDIENACFIHHFASGNSHQGNPVANHALEDVEVNGLVVSFRRDRPALVKAEQTEVIGGSSGEYRMLQEV